MERKLWNLKKTIPRLKFLEQLRNVQRRANAYSNETKTNRNSNHSYSENIKCYNCGKYGHKSKECRLRNKNSHKNNYNNNYNKENNYNNNDNRRNNYRNNKNNTRNFRKNAVAENVEIKSQSEEEERENNVNTIFDNALNVDYNDEKEAESSYAVSYRRKPHYKYRHNNKNYNKNF